MVGMASVAARRSRAGARLLSLGLAALVAQRLAPSFVSGRGATPAPPAHGAAGLSSRRAGAGAAASVKTVSETISDFYKAYPQPPLLPLFRPSIVDFLTTTHLSVMDSRFAYDAVFALGVREFFDRLMLPYDAFSRPGESEKIWVAFVGALGRQPGQVTEDAEAARSYAKATPSSQILAEIEDGAASGPMGEAFAHASKQLYSTPYGIGLFRLIELSGAELQKSTVETWAQALKVPTSRALADLENFRASLSKLSKAQELLRDNEIREKKKLAQKLEEKAKAIAAKAAAAAAARGAPAPAEQEKVMA